MVSSHAANIVIYRYTQLLYFLLKKQLYHFLRLVKIGHIASVFARKLFPGLLLASRLALSYWWVGSFYHNLWWRAATMFRTSESFLGFLQFLCQELRDANSFKVCSLSDVPLTKKAPVTNKTFLYYFVDLWLQTITPPSACRKPKNYWS